MSTLRIEPLLLLSHIEVSDILSVPYCIAFELALRLLPQLLNGFDVRIAPSVLVVVPLNLAHVLWAFPSYHQERFKLLVILRAAGRPHMATFSTSSF